MNVYNEIMHIDLVKLEAERFGMTAEQARAMLTIAGRLRQRDTHAPRETARPSLPIVTKTNVQPKLKSRTEVINLTKAQKRAYANYLEGIKSGSKNV
jgi:hypothetical protein